MSKKDNRDTLATVLHGIESKTEKLMLISPDFGEAIAGALCDFNRDDSFSEFKKLSHYMDIFATKLGLYGAMVLLNSNDAEVGQPFIETMAYLMGGVHVQLNDTKDEFDLVNFQSKHPYRSYRIACEGLFSAEIQHENSPREKLLSVALKVFDINTLEQLAVPRFGSYYLSMLNEKEKEVDACLIKALPIAIRDTLDIFDAAKVEHVKQTRTKKPK